MDKLSDVGSCDVVTSGGIQQLLIKLEASSNDQTTPDKLQNKNGKEKKFDSLPLYIQLQIFSYLDSKDLCSASLVSTHWEHLSMDNLLWHRRLKIDENFWNAISHSTNPDLFTECHSDLHFKEIYMRCCPKANSYVKNQNTAIHNLSQYIKSFLPKKIPKIAMFGPGMETSTSRIVRKIIEGTSDLFQITGMFPGRVRGLGSGFSIKLINNSVMNFTPLYSNTKEERENRTAQQRNVKSKFFKHDESIDTSEEEEIKIFPITSEMTDLLRSLDGFVFVIESSLTEAAGVENARSELFSMINDQWCDCSVPLTVFACTPSADTPRLPNIQLVRQLSLGKLNRPWQIHWIDVDDLKTCISPFEWLIKRSQRR